MMQPGSEASRNDMKAYLTGVIQEKQTSIELKEIINQIKNEYLKSSELSPFEKANIRDAIRDYEIATKKSKEIAMVCIIYYYYYHYYYHHYIFNSFIHTYRKRHRYLARDTLLGQKLNLLMISHYLLLN